MPALDAECIYLIKVLLCCSIMCLAPLSGPLVSSPPFVNMGVWLPKNGCKGRDANIFLKWGGMSKKGNGFKMVGQEKFEMQNIALLKQK